MCSSFVETVPMGFSSARISSRGLSETAGPRGAGHAAGFVVRRHIEAAGITPRRAVATGGGTVVGPWMQAVADTGN